MVREIKARIVKIIIPEAIVVTAAMLSMLGIFINICTTLFFGIGDNFTSIKQLIIFVIITIITLKLGLGNKVTTSIIADSVYDEDIADISYTVFKINIGYKNTNKEYNLLPHDIKCIYEDKSNDITLLFNNKKEKFKLVINGKNIENHSEFISTMRENGVDIKTVSDKIRDS